MASFNKWMFHTNKSPCNGSKGQNQPIRVIQRHWRWQQFYGRFTTDTDCKIPRMYNMLNTRIQSLLEAVRGFDRRERIPIPFLPPPFSSLNRLDIDRNRQFLCMDYHANVFSFFSLFRLRLAQINSRNCTYQYLRINSEQRID